MRTAFLLTVLLLFSLVALAEDGPLYTRNVTKTPDDETGGATMKMLGMYVPAQAADGTIVTIDYTEIGQNTGIIVDGIEETREYARPLIAFSHDGPDMEHKSGGVGIAHADVFAAVSLDDGGTWKKSNLSNTGFKSSFTLQDGTEYPGGTFRLFAATAGNKVLVAWASRYAKQGNPTYTLNSNTADPDNVDLSQYVKDYMLLDSTYDANPYMDDVQRAYDDYWLYLDDIWGVAGNQKSIDFADEGYPEAGEVPFAALWCCRGTLEYTEVGQDGTILGYDIVWRKPERLTSGVRDVNRIECAGVPGAGFVITWQEDPEGLRPGDGEGPGEGWSGAVAHHKTDIWYSFIDWDHFDTIIDDTDVENPVILDNFAAYEGETTPSVGVPFSIPVRLTDNDAAALNDDGTFVTPENNYLNFDFDGDSNNEYCFEIRPAEIILSYDADGNPLETKTEYMCVTEEGVLLRGNIAATRARVNLRGYDIDQDDEDDIPDDSAWVVLAYEESKGLGEDDDPEGVKRDMGKNIWYHSFDMFKPDLVEQGMMLNPPASYPDDYWTDENPFGSPFTGNEEFVNDGFAPSDEDEYDGLGGLANDPYQFMTIDPDPRYEEEAGLSTTLLQSEIARRFSLISQPASYRGTSGTVAFAMWKQGIVRQGGPADAFGRRFYIRQVEETSGNGNNATTEIVSKVRVWVEDDDEGNGEFQIVEFNETQHNPFGYYNVDCDDEYWVFLPGENPRYIRGLCAKPAQNMTSTSVIAGDIDGSESGPLTALDYPFTDPYFDDIDMSNEDYPYDSMPRVIDWEQVGPDLDGDISVTANTYNTNNFNDLSWENPFEVAKGHRGYLDGDFIMMLYCWSPNQLANAVGHDNYNLYVRRSFDGGQTWTTLPADRWESVTPLPEYVTVEAGHVVFREWYGLPGGENSAEPEEIRAYAIPELGAFEPARNISCLTGTNYTVLDPRYTPAGILPSRTITKVFESGGTVTEYEEGEYLYPDDVGNPAEFFITFEVGDNSSVADGEATPMDMYYSRAYNYGDQYEWIVSPEDDSADYMITEEDPAYLEGEGTFDWLENKQQYHAAEATLMASPGGAFFYAIWNQWQEDALEHVFDSDAIVRRLMFDDDALTVYDGVSSGGGGGSDDPPGPGGGGGGRPSKHPTGNANPKGN
jgi:hypothetical protein